MRTIRFERTSSAGVAELATALIWPPTVCQPCDWIGGRYVTFELFRYSHFIIPDVLHRDVLNELRRQIAAHPSPCGKIKSV